MPLLSISRTIYDPATKGFITSTPDAKALPNIKEWINQHNPVIYWYVLRIDNLTDASIDQWAVELYAHQALSITEVYLDGIDRRFEVRKRERDPWSEKYVLSIPRQVGIPLIGKGTRRIFFKVDIDCKEGLMHEYGISGQFIAQGTNPIEIKEKMFKYSCKVGEFRQIFDNNPDEASHYAEKRLVSKYSSNSVQIFTNSFRMIHELYGYCHSNSLNRDDLLQKLHLLHTSFESVPEIAGERISPLIHDGIRELDVIVDRDKFAPRFITLCDALVELLHIEVMGAEMKGIPSHVSPKSEPSKHNITNNEPHANSGQKECPECGNIIDSSNKALRCKECGTLFCNTCEGWYREERKRGQKPLCENCFDAEQDRVREEATKNAWDEAEGKKKKEEERLRREQEQKEKELRAKEEWEGKKRLDELRKKQEEENDRLEKEREDRERKEERLRQEKLRKQVEHEQNTARRDAEPKGRKKLEAIRRVNKKNWEREQQANLRTQERKARKGDEQKEQERQHKEKKGHEKLVSKSNSIGIKFTHIPAGEFMMGSEEYMLKPVHKVVIRMPFYLGTYPVTQREWKSVMGDNPSYFKGDDLPMDNVSWVDVQEFIKKLNKEEGTDKYRLPSDAEWEYAARARTTKRYSFGDSESKLGDYAWYRDNSGGKTHPVGQKKPNAWGLYDVHGNICEWVQDKWHNNYNDAPSDGSAWESGNEPHRVHRGGSWDDYAKSCQSAYHNASGPGNLYKNLGFRLLQEL